MCFKLGIKLIKKMLSQRDDVFFALAKRRNFQIDDIQAIIKVGTEFIGINHFFQVAISGGNDANIDFAGLTGTETHDFIFLKSAQKFHLDIHRHFTDFIKK